MKTILCYGDSNTWGFNAATGGRFDYSIRWPTRLGVLLGTDFRVIDEGLCGRTTVFDDPLTYGLNGLSTLEPIIKSHTPIDLTVIMLGTNDCKGYYGVTARNIGEGMRRLLTQARLLDAGKILLVTPINIDPGIYKTETADIMGQECSEKSMRLNEYYTKIAVDLNVYHMDANEAARANSIDYMHFDEKSLETFACALAEKIKTII